MVLYPHSGFGGKIFVLGSIRLNRESIDSRFLQHSPQSKYKVFYQTRTEYHSVHYPHIFLVVSSLFMGTFSLSCVLEIPLDIFLCLSSIHNLQHSNMVCNQRNNIYTIELIICHNSYLLFIQF